jgi:alpha-tubulin suppressor-like RCC1 family protein
MVHTHTPYKLTYIHKHSQKHIRTHPGTDDCLLSRRIIHVTAGHMHTLALDSYGIVWGFGHNKYGQLCQGKLVQKFGDAPIANFENSYVPLRMHLPVDVKILDVVAGFYHNLAVSVDGGLFAWGKNDRGQLGREHLEDDSCHLEVKTPLPYDMDVQCGKSTPPNGVGKPVKRLKLCNIVPGNSTLITAGEMHSGAVTKSVRPSRSNSYKYYPGAVVNEYETSAMFGDCTGDYGDVCKEQGLLLRQPTLLSGVYMFGDNRFGQLGLDTR